MNIQLNKIFESGGGIAAALPAFQPRESQAAMASAVDEAFAEGNQIMVEAGTGVGKSLAYLIPLIHHAREAGQPGIVSTHTLNLQKQLLDKDIPLALKALGGRATVVRAMGRSNYFCQLRFSLLGPSAAVPALPGVEAGPLQRLADWAEMEDETTKDRLPSGIDASLWEKVNVDPFGCPGHQCPHARECFFLKERNAMARADLVLVNHALLLSDIAARRQGSSVLPDAAFLVVDEAHHLEAVAAEHLGLRLSPAILRHLFLAMDDGRGGGILVRSEASEELHEFLDGCRQDSASFFAELADKLPTKDSSTAIEMKDVPQAPALIEEMKSLAMGLSKLRQKTQDEALSSELAGTSARLRQAAEGLADWTRKESRNTVYWLEWNTRERAPQLRSAPLEVGPLLADELYSRHRSVVMTSATLSTGGDFRFMKSRLGYQPQDHSISLDSPFDFYRSVRMYLFGNLPDPRRDEAGWLAALPLTIEGLLQQSGGRAFVLFTSYKHLRQISAKMKDWIEEQGWELLVQDPSQSRERLLQRFKKGRGVLMGTSSFWEGVDVPGEALSAVIVAKLPFAAPDTPLERARADRVEEQGGTYFKDLSLPEAQLRLKQGFGRLIRHEDDEGLFALLDPRAVKVGYGKLFIRALPACRTWVDGEEIPTGE